MKCPEGSIQTGHLRLEGLLNLVALGGYLFLIIYIELDNIASVLCFGFLAMMHVRS